jgi:hypothetical protein
MKPLSFALLVFLSLAMPTRAQAEQFYFVIVEWPSTDKWEAPAPNAKADTKLITKAFIELQRQDKLCREGQDEKYVLDIALNFPRQILTRKRDNHVSVQDTGRHVELRSRGDGQGFHGQASGTADSVPGLFPVHHPQARADMDQPRQVLSDLFPGAVVG